MLLTTSFSEVPFWTEGPAAANLACAAHEIEGGGITLMRRLHEILKERELRAAPDFPRWHACTGSLRKCLDDPLLRSEITSALLFIAKKSIKKLGLTPHQVALLSL